MAIQLILGKFLLFGGTLAASGLMIAQPIVWPNLFGYRSVFVIVESETVNNQSSDDLYETVSVQNASTGSAPETKKRNYECSLTDNDSIESTDKICKIYEIKTKNSFFLNDLETHNKPNLTSAETPELDDLSIKKEDLKIANKFFMVQITEGLYKKIQSNYSTSAIDVKPIKPNGGGNFAKFKPLFVVNNGGYDVPKTKYALINNRVDAVSGSGEGKTFKTGEYKCSLGGGKDVECKILKFSDDHKHSSEYKKSTNEQLTVKDNEFYLIQYTEAKNKVELKKPLVVKSTSEPAMTAIFNNQTAAILTGTDSSESIFVMYKKLNN